MVQAGACKGMVKRRELSALGGSGERGTRDLADYGRHASHAAPSATASPTTPTAAARIVARTEAVAAAAWHRIRERRKGVAQEEDVCQAIGAPVGVEQVGIELARAVERDVETAARQRDAPFLVPRADAATKAADAAQLNRIKDWVEDAEPGSDFGALRLRAMAVVMVVVKQSSSALSSSAWRRLGHVDGEELVA